MSYETAYCCQQHMCAAERGLEPVLGVFRAIKFFFQLLVWISAASNEWSQVKGKHGDIRICVSSTESPLGREAGFNVRQCLSEVFPSPARAVWKRQVPCLRTRFPSLDFFLMAISQDFRFWRTDFVWSFEQNEEIHTRRNRFARLW